MVERILEDPAHALNDYAQVLVRGCQQITQGLLFWLLKGGFKVGLGVFSYRSSYGDDFGNSDIASPASPVTGKGGFHHSCFLEYKQLFPKQELPMAM